jgi:hypothetical protein
MYVTKSDEKILPKIVDLLATLIMMFSFLGKQSSQAASSLCETFINALHKQIDECRKLPERKFDTFGEVHFLEHKKRMTDIALNLDKLTNGEEFPDMEQMFSLFLLNLLYHLIEKSKVDSKKKASVTQRNNEMMFT